MKEAHVFRFTAGERVLGTEPESGAEREMHYYVNDDAVAKLAIFAQRPKMFISP